MGRAGIVVDAERETTFACHCSEMLEHLILGERRVGDGRQEASGGACGFRILRQPDRLIGAQGADTDEDW